MTPSNKWRSEPQMAQDVTLMMASRPSWIFGSGTVSQRMSPLPCQVSAFMRASSGFRVAVRAGPGVGSHALHAAAMDAAGNGKNGGKVAGRCAGGRCDVHSD